MISVYKYRLYPGRNVYKLPAGAEILHVEEWQGETMFWAKVDTEAEVVSRDLYVAGTGHSLYEDVGLAYVGTFTVERVMKWHLFEVRAMGA